MRHLTPHEISAVSGGATAPTPAPARGNPFITVPLALFNGIFTVFNVITTLPTLLTLRF
jgi:hypothetical protein